MREWGKFVIFSRWRLFGVEKGVIVRNLFGKLGLGIMFLRFYL